MDSFGRVFTARKLVHYERTGETLSAEQSMPFEDWPPMIDPSLVKMAMPGRRVETRAAL